MMIPAARSFQDSPPHIFDIVFTNVKHLTRMMTLPRVCKGWQKYIEGKYGKLFCLNSLATTILKEMECPLALDKFLSQHVKSTYSLLNVVNSNDYSYILNWPEGSTSIACEYYECVAREGIHFYAIRHSDGSLHPDNSKMKSLRVPISLICKETSKVLEERQGSAVTDAYGYFTASRLVNPFSIYRNVEFEVNVCENEKLKRWASKKKYQTILKEIKCHLTLFYESHIQRVVNFNCLAIKDLTLKSCDPAASFYCYASGQIQTEANQFGFRFKIVVGAVDFKNGQFIKALSWQPNSNDEFYAGVDSAMRHAVLARTTHYLSQKFGLKLYSELSGPQIPSKALQS